MAQPKRRSRLLLSVFIAFALAQLLGYRHEPIHGLQGQLGWLVPPLPGLGVRPASCELTGSPLAAAPPASIVAMVKTPKGGVGRLQMPALAAAFALPGVGPDVRWWFESCIGIGAVRTGLPTLSVQILWLAPLGTMRRIVADKSIGKLPLLPYSAMMINGFIWATYGLLLGKSGVWLPSLIGGIFGTAYTIAFLRYSPAKADWLPGSRNAHFTAILSAAGFISAVVLGRNPSTAAQILGVLGNIISVIMFSGPLAALRTVLEERSTRSLPFGFTIVTTLNCTLWTFYACFVLQDPALIIPNGLGLISGLAQLSLFARFGFAK